MPESLSERLAAIKEAQAQKISEVNEAHGEALKTNGMHDAQTEAQREDELRTELGGIKEGFNDAQKDVRDASFAVGEAKAMLRDPDIDPETRMAVQALVEEARGKFDQFDKLKERRKALEGEIAALNGELSPSQQVESLMTAGADVRVLRSSGQLEGGWKIMHNLDTKVVVYNSEGVNKTVPTEEFLSWQGREVTQ